MVEQQTQTAGDVSKKCFGCGKPMKKLKRYYRNGHYFCNKNCWKTKERAGQEAAKAAAAQTQAPAEAKG